MNKLMNAIPTEVLENIGELDLNIESHNCLDAINDILGRTVLSGGKRLRPMLTYLMGNLFNVKVKDLSPYAKAIEMVHAASLAHDDVVDNATQRRGNPSINIEASNKKAVLAGDFLLADVISGLAAQGDLKIVQEMSKVIQDLALGEWIQSDAIEGRTYSRELIEQIAEYKTASVMKWCTWVSSHVIGAPVEIQEAAGEFGRRLGLAFQMMDDTLDFSKDSNKDHMLDIENGVVNSVILEWLYINEDKYNLYKEGSSLVDIWSEKGISQAVEATKVRARKHMDVANNCLLVISKYQQSKGMGSGHVQDLLDPLEFIMSYIIDRDH